MAWAILQNTNQGTGATPVSAVFGSTPAQNNLVWASVLNQSNANTPTVSDSNGAWTLAAGITANNQGAFVFYQIAAASQPTTITADIVTGTGKISVYEASGNLTTLGSVLDVTGTGSTGTTTVTDTSTIAPGVTITDAGDLIFTTVGMNGLITSPAVDSSFTLQQSNTSAATRLIDATRIPGSIATYTPIFSWTSAMRARQVTVAFKPAATAARPKSLTLLGAG